MTRRLLVLAALACGSLLSAMPGCAVSEYGQASLWATDVRTIAVPIFENHTFSREVEFQLTDAVIKAIESRTPYRVAAQASADTILIGHVREVRLEQLSGSGLTGLGEEVVLSVTIDFEWRDLSTDEVRVARENFTGNGLFVPSAPTNERIEIGRLTAVEQLANDIVDTMQSAW